MSESEPSSQADSIQGFTKSFKLSQPSERIVSFNAEEYMELLRVSAWSVRWVLSVRVDAKPKRTRLETTAATKYMAATGKTFVLYRRRILELLRWPKPAFDQLALELPCLMGFRAKEVTTWRAEYIDWVNADTLVLDAKKNELIPVPLNAVVARHAMAVLGARTEGYVLRPRSNRCRHREGPMTPIAAWHIWHKWNAVVCGRLPINISPVVGRRFFAAEWHYSQGLSLVTLSRILRHSSPEVTWRYIQSLVFHEDVKRDYDSFQLGLMQEDLPMSTAVRMKA